MREIALLTWKDLRIQFRSPKNISQMVLLGLILIVILNIGFGPEYKEPATIASGAIWVVLSFISISNLNYSFSLEKEGESLKAIRLTGLNPEKIFISKYLSSFIIMCMTSLLIVPVTLVSIDFIKFGFFLPIFLLIIIGAAGFSSVGVIMAAMNSSTNYNENFLSIITLPFIMPIIIFIVNSTKYIFENQTLSGATSWIIYLIAYDLFFFTLSYIFFQRIIEE